MQIKKIYTLRNRKRVIGYDCVVVADNAKHARVIAAKEFNDPDYYTPSTIACRRIGDTTCKLKYGVLANME